jgi:hypothetical protein
MKILYLTLAFALAAAAQWSAPVEVTHDDKPVVRYRAMWDGETVIVRASIEPGWHTFVMDNKQRQQEKLAGKSSLGIEKSTEVVVADGLTTTGPWRQSPPKDLSKPEIRWYTWGFEREAVFAAKAKRTGAAGPARVEVTGQACYADICKNIDVTLTVPLKPAKPDVNLASLTAVRER